MPDGLDLGHHPRDEALPPEAGVHGHHQHLVDVAEYVLEGARRRRRVQHHAGPRAHLADLRDAAVEVGTGLDVDAHDVGPRLHEVAHVALGLLDHEVDVEG